MAKTLEERIQLLLGNKDFRICQLEGEVEILHAKIIEMEQQTLKPTPEP